MAKRKTELQDDIDAITRILPDKQPDVSVLLPVHNGLAHYPAGMLQRAIISVLEDQPSVSVELCICDDGSTDDTWQFVSDIQDSRVKVTRSEYVGVGEATNKAAALSTGRYLFEFSARAVLKPNSLRHLVKALDTHLDAGFACAQMEVWGNINHTHVPPVYDRQKYTRSYVANFYMCRASSFHEHGCRYTDYITLDDGWRTGMVDRDYLMQLMYNLDWGGIALQDVPFVEYYFGGDHQGTQRLHQHERQVQLEFRARWGKYL